MSEPTKKTEPTEQEGKTTELLEKDLEQAAGGSAAQNNTLAKHKAAQSIAQYAGS